MDRNRIDITNEMLAGRGKRFANYIVDVIVYYIIMFLIGLVAGLLQMLFEYDGMLVWISEMTDLNWILMGIAIISLYYIIMESLFQRTIGKMITGTKVVMEDGTKPPAGVIALRTLCRFIPFEPFSLFSESGRGWHDGLTDTCVVEAKKYKAALELKNSFDEIGNKAGLEY